MVTAENIEETHIITITVTAKTAEEAEMLADTYADVTGSIVEEKFHVPKPRLFEGATPAVKSVSSDAKRNYTAGGFINMDIEFLFLTDNDNFKCPQTEEEDS